MRASLSVPLSSAVQPAAAPALSSSERLPGLDLLRLVAVLAIVWFHSHAPGSSFLDWRLPALLLLSATLAMQHSDGISFAMFARRRAGRLLRPWVIWSLVYAALGIALAIARAQPFRMPFRMSVFVEGTCYHLWYLPFAFLAAVSVKVIREATRSWKGEVTFLAALLVGVALVLVCSRFWRGSSLPEPLPKYIYGIPAIPLGICVAMGLRGTDLRRRAERLGLITLILVFVWGCSAIPALAGIELPRGPHAADNGLITRYALAVMLVCVGAAWRGGMPRGVAEFSQIAMGVYLIHPAVAQALLRVRWLKGGSVIYGLTLVTLSIVAAELLQRTPLRKWT